MTRAQPASQPKTDSADAGSKNQVAADSALLLQLATDLKTEVDKTNKDTLSLTVIRKAEAIEKLAHKVRDQVKPKAGAG